jgi:enoyl-CoA hydratase
VSFTTITAATDGRVGILTFNRPQVLNAFDPTLMAEVGVAMRAFEQDPAVAAIVVTGSGGAFSGGFDTKVSVGRPPLDAAGMRRVLKDDFAFIMQFWDCEKPTVAGIHGYCPAGAFELALPCDITVAAGGIRFGEPEVRFGSGIVAMLLPWIVGPKHAKELLLTATTRSQTRALVLGIVNYVVPAGEKMEKAMALARDIAAAVAGPVSDQARDQPQLRDDGNAPGAACGALKRHPHSSAAAPSARSSTHPPRAGAEGGSRLAQCAVRLRPSDPQS